MNCRTFALTPAVTGESGTLLYLPFLSVFFEVVDCRYSVSPAVHDLFPEIMCWHFPHAVASAGAIFVLVVFIPVNFGAVLLSVGRKRTEGTGIVLLP